MELFIESSMLLVLSIYIALFEVLEVAFIQLRRLVVIVVVLTR
jgi:hypothetical protein